MKRCDLFPLIPGSVRPASPMGSNERVIYGRHSRALAMGEGCSQVPRSQGGPGQGQDPQAPCMLWSRLPLGRDLFGQLGPGRQVPCTTSPFHLGRRAPEGSGVQALGRGVPRVFVPHMWTGPLCASPEQQRSRAPGPNSNGGPDEDGRTSPHAEGLGGSTGQWGRGQGEGEGLISVLLLRAEGGGRLMQAGEQQEERPGLGPPCATTFQGQLSCLVSTRREEGCVHA